MKHFGLACAMLFVMTAAHAGDLLVVKSSHSVTETLDRVETTAKANGFVIVARVDHAAAADKVALPLRPTALLIFGRAQAGTPLMQCDQRVGIDLPVKALAWEDATGQVWLGMVDPAVLKARYDLPSACDAPLQAMQMAVQKLLSSAAG